MIRAWRALPSERRLAVYACGGLFLSLFLPWYQETLVVVGKSASTSLTGWQAFSFVEAAVLLVAAGVLTLLFHRAEGRAFHLPGGDGWVVSAAGAWACALIVWRIFDKQSVSVHGPGAAVSGIEWGIFAALALAGLLLYAGSRIRAAHQPEPPLPGEAGNGAVAGLGPVSPPGPEPVAPVAAPSMAAAGPGAAADVPEPAAPKPAIPAPVAAGAARPRGWLSAPPKQRREQPADEQLTIPLDDEQH